MTLSQGLQEASKQSGAGQRRPKQRNLSLTRHHQHNSSPLLNQRRSSNGQIEPLQFVVGPGGVVQPRAVPLPRPGACDGEGGRRLSTPLTGGARRESVGQKRGSNDNTPGQAPGVVSLAQVSVQNAITAARRRSSLKQRACSLIGTNTDLGVSGDESTSLTKTEINAYRQAAMEDVCGTRCHMRYGDVAREEVRARVEQRRPSAAPGGGGGGGGASLDQGLRRPSIPANANGGGRQLRSQSIRRISQESSSCAAREGAPPRVPITSSRNSEEEWKEEVSGTMRRCSTDLTQLHERLGNLEKALSSIARCTGAGAVATADQGASTPSRVSTGSKPGNRPAIGNREESPPPDLSERLKQWVGIGGSSGGAPAADLSA